MAIHWSFLGAEPEWLKKKSPYKAEPRPVTLTLMYHEPQSPKISSIKAVNVPRKVKQKRLAGQRPPKKVLEPLKPVKTPSQLTHASKPEQPEMVQESPDRLPDPTKEALQEQAFDAGDKEVLTPPVRIAYGLRQTGPTYRKNAAPGYPRLARIRGYEGTVVLEVLVDRMGIVDNLHVFESSGYPILDRAAVTSVRKWLFEPGMRGDERVDVWVKIPIRFELK